MIEKYKFILEKIILPNSRKNLAEVDIFSGVTEKSGVVYVMFDGKKINLSANDLYFLKRKVECAFDEIAQIRAICIIESDKPEFAQLNNKSPSDISGMFTKISSVRNTIVVASGKGGVGKTSIAVLMARNLAKNGSKVGIVDLDVYGPSVPNLLGIKARHQFENGKILPHRCDNLQIASLGMMISDGEPIIWRGPMLHKALQQLLREVAWEDLDYLILDTPPGTGDVHISLCQKVPIDSVVIVTTNDPVAIASAQRNANMFAKLGNPVGAIIANMSYIDLPSEKRYIFGETANTKAFQERQNVPYLLEIPMLSKEEMVNYAADFSFLPR